MYNTIKDLEAAGIVKKSEAPEEVATESVTPPKEAFWDRYTIAGFVAMNAFCAFIYIGLPIVFAK